MDFQSSLGENFNNFANWLTDFSYSVDIFWYLVLVYFISSFIYWLGSRFLNKRRNDTFDGWFLVTILTMGWGRIAYVISNWDYFINYYWFYLPYERYADQVYFLRAMPWKLLTIWDGGFLFTAMLVAFMLACLLYVAVFKRWSVREMSGTVGASITFMLSGIFLSYGWLLPDSDFSKTIFDSGLILGVAGIAVIVFNGIFATGKNDKWQLKYRVRDYANLVYLIAFSYVAYSVFNSTELTTIDNINIWIYLLLTAIFVILGFIGFNDKEKVVVSTVPSTAPTRNRALKSTIFK